LEWLCTGKLVGKTARGQEEEEERGRARGKKRKEGGQVPSLTEDAKERKLTVVGRGEHLPKEEGGRGRNGKMRPFLWERSGGPEGRYENEPERWGGQREW